MNMMPSITRETLSVVIDKKRDKLAKEQEQLEEAAQGYTLNSHSFSYFHIE